VIEKFIGTKSWRKILELWRRVKEYDQKAAEVPFIPVLTRKQKQHL